jgi:hypothetical protein
MAVSIYAEFISKACQVGGSSAVSNVTFDLAARERYHLWRN